MIEYADSSTERIYKTAAAWKDGNRITELQFKPAKKVVRLFLGNEHIPDVNSENNIYEAK